MKISPSEKGNNSGSVGTLANYLEKENKRKPFSKREWFFSHEKDKVGIGEVVDSIDNNKRNLGKKDAKFFMLTISPSEDELRHIGNDPRKLKAYTREVMDAYAANFGKGLQGKDLMFFAKVEHERKFKGTDPEVKSGKAKQGQKKPGLQTHIHIIVSRKDKANKLKLSPLSNHRRTQKGPVKGGFDRKAFFTQAEKIFDKKFQYERAPEDHFAFKDKMKNGTAKERILAKVQLRRTVLTKEIGNGKSTQVNPGKSNGAQLVKKLSQALRHDFIQEEKRRKTSQDLSL